MQNISTICIKLSVEIGGRFVASLSLTGLDGDMEKDFTWLAVGLKDCHAKGQDIVTLKEMQRYFFAHDIELFAVNLRNRNCSRVSLESSSS